MLVLVVWSLHITSSKLFVGIWDCGGESIANVAIVAMLIRSWLAFELDSERVNRYMLAN